MAPMTRQFSPGGVPGADVAAYYARRAPHVGLIVTEGTYVDHPSAGSSDRVPRFYGDDALAGWRGVTQAVHAAGGKIVPQLWHLGATRAAGAPPHPDAPVLSPSGRRADGSVVGEPATTAELDAVVASFARAARDAQLAGFDGVELHGAHGYLLDQFLWSGTNGRGDRHGGSAANRPGWVPRWWPRSGRVSGPISRCCSGSPSGRAARSTRGSPRRPGSWSRS